MKTWEIHKHQIETDRGIVAAQHFEAAAAGARVLAEGGNAIDAAVVTALVLSVVEPWLSGVGGGGFLLYGDGKSGAVETLDFNVRASRNLDPGAYTLVGGDGGDWFNWPAIEGDRNIIGYSSICIPGSVAGLAEALSRHGTMDWADALAPAIACADRGLELDWFTALCLAIDAQALATDPVSANLFLENGKPPRNPANGGARFLPMPGQAAFLRLLAERGAREMYEGETARRIAADLRAGGSAIDFTDLETYRPRWAEPGRGGYRGYDIHTVADLSGGPSLLSVMDRLSRELAPGEAPDAAAMALYANAIRAEYEVRLKTMGHAGKPDGDCTSHLCVVDAQGNMVSLTNTLLSRFGSKVTLPSTGALMNNGMMWFDPRPNMPNSMAPGAQPLANMCPLLLTKDARPVMAIGAAGGRQIFPALVQLLSYMLDYGMNAEDAFNAPRIDASTPKILVDRGADADAVAQIGRHHKVELVNNTLHPVQFAVPTMVAVGPDGTRTGMAHPLHPWAQAVAEPAG